MTQPSPARPLSQRRALLAAATALLMGVGLVGVAATPATAAGTGVIAGTVTGVGNAPLEGVSLQLFYCDEDYDPTTQLDCWKLLPGNTLTAVNGSFQFTGLDAGQYRASIFPQSNNAQYAYEYWNNALTYETATTITVADGATTTINPNLQLGATISGTVLGDDGQPGDDIMVSATNTATPNQSSTAFVQPDGSYQFTGLQPGEYYLWAGPDYDSESTLVREYYDNKPDAASANRFTVASGATVTANFELATGGIISGNVKNTSNANLADIDVTVSELDEYGYWRQIDTAVTDASGNYVVDGLETGTYVVRFSDFGGSYGQRYAGNVVDRSAATEYEVGPGANATNVNGQLTAGGTLAGTVTQTPTGGSAVPSNDAYVDVIKVAGGVHEVVETVRTNESGVYSLSGLAAGSYTIQTFGDNSASWAWTYRGPAYYPEDATTVAVSGTATANAGTTNVVPGTTLEGYFTDTNFAPVPSVRVNILYERTPGNWVAPPPHGGAGDINYYRVGGMPPGKYIVYFEDTATTDKYVTQYYNNKPTLGTADIIDASNGGEFSDITARMTKSPWPAVTASAIANPASPNGSNGWYTSGNVSVTLTSGGGTAVPDTLQYKLGSGAWTTYTAPIVVSSNGSTVITYRAEESGLQYSAEGTLTVKRDAAAPTVSSSLSGRTVTVTSADTGSSGVASTEYKLGSGAWTAYTAPVNVGNAAVTMQFRATDAAGNVSTVGERVVPASAVTTDRIAGSNRYETATLVSEASYPDGAGVVYVTTGTVFADALSAGPVAALDGGPLLLVDPGSLPPVVADEITRLAPDRIVVIGGEPSVSAAVYDQLGEFAPEIERVGGADRFDTSRKVTSFAFDQADIAYITTGTTFPDALAAGGAAGLNDAPIVLVNGGGTGLDVATEALLDDLGVTEVKVLGGPGSVSEAILDDLVAKFGPENAIRLSGADRFATSAAINADAFLGSGATDPNTVFLATGQSFPDALAGSAWAAKESSPLYVVRQDCVPQYVLDDLEELEPSRIVLLGGTPSLSPAVENLTPCL